MTQVSATCPLCHSENARLLSDQYGSVGWCSDCDRPWIPSQRPVTFEQRMPAPVQTARAVEFRRAG